MPRVYPRIAAAVAMSLVLLPLLSLSPSLTNAQRGSLDTYAITNARIVTVSGAPIERGTVVIRDGLIAAVGANVTAPADARVIDGAGLTVYPGLIDSSTSLGIPQPTPAPGAAPGGGLAAAVAQFRAQTSTTVALNSTQPAGLQPEVLVEDYLRPGGEQIEARALRE